MKSDNAGPTLVTPAPSIYDGDVDPSQDVPSAEDIENAAPQPGLLSLPNDKADPPPSILSLPAPAPSHRSTAAPLAASRTDSSSGLQLPTLSLLIPQPPVSAVPLIFRAAADGAEAQSEGLTGETSAGVHPPQTGQAAESAEPAPLADVALHVNIRFPGQSLPEPPAVRPTSSPSLVYQTAAPPTVATLQPSGAPQTALSPSATTVVEHSAAFATSSSNDALAPHADAPVLLEPVTKETPTGPARSVALEFAPDGAGDIRVRVAERAGEVHITLHSSDTVLSGQLHEGVRELLGSLSRAGYEAEAWAGGQDPSGGNQRRQEQRKQQSVSSKDRVEFGEFLGQQSIQEVS